MIFEDFCFVYISTDYLEELHRIDSEVFCSSETDYSKKPHLGILTNLNGRKYVIPLTSAKPKHAAWRDITPTNYRVYEEIDIRKTVVDRFDVIVDETDVNKLRRKGVSEEEFDFHKKRILSVLEIKKMFPVVEGVYERADLSTPSSSTPEEQRRMLMIKEYFFCKKYKNQIQTKAARIYERQMETGVVAPFHCNFRNLEEAADAYRKIM